MTRLWTAWALIAAGLFTGGVFLSGQTAMPRPRRGSGDSVTGAFEGWFSNPDGSRAFLVGYYNRNSQQQLDVPIGTWDSPRIFFPDGSGACS